MRGLLALGLAVAVIRLGVAEAASGWYLLIPPDRYVRTDTGEPHTGPLDLLRVRRSVNLSAPLREWDQLHAFSSARECQDAVEGIKEELGRYKSDPDEAAMRRELGVTAHAHVQRFAHARLQERRASLATARAGAGAPAHL